MGLAVTKPDRETRALFPVAASQSLGVAVRPRTQSSAQYRGVFLPGENRRNRFADKYHLLGVKWVTSSLSRTPARPASADSSLPPPAEIGKGGLPETPARVSGLSGSRVGLELLLAEEARPGLCLGVVCNDLERPGACPHLLFHITCSHGMLHPCESVVYDFVFFNSF